MNSYSIQLGNNIYRKWIENAFIICNTATHAVLLAVEATLIVLAETGSNMFNLKGCAMCDWGNTVTVKVLIPDDLSHSGKAYWKDAPTDSCIADIVEALQSANINMRGSCCGHNKQAGCIALEDGRQVTIMPRKQAGCTSDKQGDIFGDDDEQL